MPVIKNIIIFVVEIETIKIVCYILRNDDSLLYVIFKNLKKKKFYEQFIKCKKIYENDVF
jgi:hypothetical protein